MKIRRSISKSFTHRILLFFAVILGAVIFDAFHNEPVSEIDMCNHQTNSHDLQASDIFFFNPVSTFKIRTGVEKLFSGIVFAGSQNEFLKQYHNYRSFHLLKAESLNKWQLFSETAHFMLFNHCHHVSPVDVPAIA